MTTGIHVDIDELIALRGAARDLRLHALRRVSGERAGAYISPLRGRGLMYEESRVYQAGDDTRHIDWRVTARTEKPHTKLFREERERPVWLVVDQGADMQFGTRVAFKSVVAARLAAVLAWSARAQGDRVGGVVFDDTQAAWQTPQGGDRGVIHSLRLMAQPRALMPCNGLAGAIQRAAHAARPGSLIYILSDFARWNDADARTIQHLAQHCDVVMIRIYDALEETPPPGGLYGVGDGTQSVVWDTRNTALVTRYTQEFSAKGARLASFCRRHRIAWLEHRTDTPVTQTVTAIAQAHGTQR